MRRSLTTAACVLGVAWPALSAPSGRFQLKESVQVPRAWTEVAVPDADHVITLRIGLHQPSFHKLEDHLYDVSNPYSARYGEHLSKAEVEALVAPHPDSVTTVSSWLESHGVHESHCRHSPAKDWIIVNAPIRKVENMLNATYHVYRHESGEEIVRTTSFSLPGHVFDHIEVLQPTTVFGRLKPMNIMIDRDHKIPSANANHGTVKTISGAEVNVSCNTTITISCLQQLYQINGYTPTMAKENKIGITGYLGFNANIADLQAFYTRMRPEAVNTSFRYITVNGGSNSQAPEDAGVEANLDTQYALGLSFPTPGTFWSTGGEPPIKFDLKTASDTNEPYAVWLDHVLAQESVPQVITTSYDDDEQTVPESYARRVCAGFAQLGARGVSVIVSSGDFGVGDGNSNPVTQQCITNDGKNNTRFIPMFPATCPFVTAVGGTRYIEEQAVPFSSGGFSNYFARPHYQDIAVKSYLKRLPKHTYKDLYNPAGRAFPDVSAQASGFSVNVGGKVGLVAGTSASSPTFAAIVALLNDARLEAGRPTLGFLNPLLYSKGVVALNDITVGNNPGCGTPGFHATEGDPVTGLGTPNFHKLLKMVLTEA